MADMNDLQRALWLAWVEAEKKVAHLTGTKPQDPGFAPRHWGVPGTREAWEKYRDDLHDWREDWNTALGFRDGLRKACVIAKVPNFTED